jgi:uncharacterized protein DUF4386
MGKVSDWFPPLTGILFVALVVVGFALVGETPDATEDSAQEVLDFYADDDDKIGVGSILVGLGSVFLLFFAGWLRRLLRRAEGADGILSAVSYGGAVVLAVGLVTSAAFTFGIADVADNIEDPIVFQTLNALSWGYWLPLAAGTITFMVATGISVVRHGALPTWLGWVAIVAGILMFSPAFIVAGPVVGLWILFVSVMGMMGRVGAAGAPPA